MVYCGVGGTVNGSVCLSDVSYSKDDFQNIVVDGLGTGGAAFVSWIDLIVLLVILGFIIGIFVKLANLFK